MVYNLFQPLAVKEIVGCDSRSMSGKVKQMLFRPSFCANCGEKIERAEWKIWTSRRFCPVCESEYKGQDLLPRVIVGLGILAGVFGFGSYLKSGSADSDMQAMRQPRKFAVQPAPAAQLTAANSASQQFGNTNTAVANQPDGQPPLSANKKLNGSQALPQLSKPKTEADEPMYYCGAATKKGTPCSRRVKGNIRCYQHVGMPAMASAGKLRVN